MSTSLNNMQAPKPDVREMWYVHVFCLIFCIPEEMCVIQLLPVLCGIRMYVLVSIMRECKSCHTSCCCTFLRMCLLLHPLLLLSHTLCCMRYSVVVMRTRQHLFVYIKCAYIASTTFYIQTCTNNMQQ